MSRSSVPPFIPWHCELEAVGMSLNGHTFSSDLTPVSYSLLRAHHSTPRVTMSAKLHYGGKGFDES